MGWVVVILVVNGADQGAASVTLASVLLRVASGADKAVVQLKQLAQPGGPQLVLAGVVLDKVKGHLLEDLLVVAALAEPVLAPASGVAPGGVVRSVLVGQADRSNVVLQDKLILQVDKSKVILEVASVVGWVDGDSGGSSVLVLQGLNHLTGVPLSAADLQGLRGFNKVAARVKNNLS